MNIDLFEKILSVVVNVGLIFSGVASFFYVLIVRYKRRVRLKMTESILQYALEQKSQGLIDLVKRKERHRVAQMSALQKIIENPYID